MIEHLRSKQVEETDLHRMDDDGGHQTAPHRDRAYKRRFIRLAEQVARTHKETGFWTVPQLEAMCAAWKTWKEHA